MTLDTVRFDCDGDGWRVSADVIGRASNVRAALVRTEGEAASFSLALTGPEQALPDDAPFQPFQTRFEDAATPCSRDGLVVAVEALDADGRAVDCVVLGERGADVLSGKYDGRLAAVPHGDWKACRVR